MSLPSNSFINAPQDVVTDAINGFLLLNPHLSTLPPPNNHVIYHPLPPPVPILTGGGSGHEPSHGGWVGGGMVSAAVCGGTFASPSVGEIISGVKAVTTGREGLVMVVKNYTGDRINFATASEIVRREMGLECETVYVADDSAVPLGKGKTGRRGVAGTVFVHKCAGAVAKKGGNVGEVAEAGRNVSNRLVSMGVSLTGCEVPGAGEGRDNMPGKVMFGMGIHGETGNSTVDSTDLKSSDIMSKVVGELCSFGWDQLGRGVEEHMEEIVSGDEIVVLVNNLGGTSVFEMCIVVNDVLKCFKEKGIKVIRIYSGSYMTSFDMKGVSVTALVLNGDRERIMGWLDEETECEEWRKGTDLVDGGVVRVGKRAAEEEKEETKGEDGKVEANKWGDACQEMLEIIVSKVAEKVREMESTLTSYDKITGDGDCGITVRRGVEAVEKGVKEGTVATDKGLGRFFGDVADAVGANMGGTSGGLMHIMLLSMSTAIAGFDGEVGWKEVAAAFNEAVRKMDEAGGAGRGARTMLDSIYPVCDLLESGETQWAGLAKAAREGAEGTSTMKALAGRSNYVDEKAVEGTPDPGAWAVMGIIECLTATWGA